MSLKDKLSVSHESEVRFDKIKLAVRIKHMNRSLTLYKNVEILGSKIIFYRYSLTFNEIFEEKASVPSIKINNISLHLDPRHPKT